MRRPRGLRSTREPVHCEVSLPRIAKRLLLAAPLVGTLSALVILMAPASALAACSAPVADAYSNAVLADSPVVFYRLDDSVGPAMCDSSGNASDGIYSDPSKITFGVPGPLGGSATTAVTADLSGVSNGPQGGIGTGPFPTADTGNHSFTLEAWYRSTVAQTQALVAIASFDDLSESAMAGLAVWHDPAAGHGSANCTNVASVFAFDTYDGSLCWVADQHGLNLFDGAWHYLAIAYDATAGTATGYVDGHDLGAQTAPQLNIAAGGSAQVLVGDWVDNNLNQSFQGNEADVAVYPTALSATAISAHYAAASPKSQAPVVKIKQVKVGGSALAVTVNTSGAGTVNITGTGLKKMAVALPSGTSTLKVLLTKAGKRDRTHHKTITVAVSLTAAGSTASASEKIRL